MGIRLSGKFGNAARAAPQFQAAPVALIFRPDHGLGVIDALELGRPENVAIRIQEIKPVTDHARRRARGA